MKQFYLLKVFGLLLFFSLSFTSKADVCSTMSDGLWTQPEIWSCGHQPACGDTIYINHYVEVNVNVDLDETPGCFTPTYIVITGTGHLHFQMGRKMWLACGSGFSIEAGGQLTASSYSGANNFLQWCSNIYWQASDGPQSGPQVFGSGLPVEFVNFSAYYNGNDVNLQWSTASESNNDFFTIERSQNGIEFEPISIVDGAGTSNIMLNYFEIDHNPLTGTSYYRLKQTDFNGNFTYSQIQMVKSEDQLSTELLLYPNPTDQNFFIQFNGFGEEEFQIEISDITGKKEFSKVITTSSDLHIEAIDISSKLASGTYIVTACSNNVYFMKKLMVK